MFVYIYTLGLLFSYLVYLVIFRIMDFCDYYIEINFVFLLFILVIVLRYIVELVCGFGVIVLLVVIFIVIYYVYWLEMVLFYRVYFGIDEIILGE